MKRSERKMDKRQVLVIGLGRFGSSIAKTLCEDGVQVMAIDRRMDLVEEMRDHLTQVVQADSMDHDSMKALGVGEFDTAFVTIGADIKASCVTTMLLKELGVKHIVCKAHDDVHRQVLLKLGADQVVIPEQENALRLARSLSSFNVLDYIELSDDYGIIDVPAPNSWVGKTLKELNVRAKMGVNIIAVESGSVTNVSPSADYRIQSGDIMVVLGDNMALEAVQKL